MPPRIRRHELHALRGGHVFPIWQCLPPLPCRHLLVASAVAIVLKMPIRDIHKRRKGRSLGRSVRQMTCRAGSRAAPLVVSITAVPYILKPTCITRSCLCCEVPHSPSGSGSTSPITPHSAAQRRHRAHLMPAAAAVGAFSSYRGAAVGALRSPTVEKRAAKLCKSAREE